MGDRFADWPSSLPREDLVRLLRGYAGECRAVEQILAVGFPEKYPLGDGEVFPADQRVVVEEDGRQMAQEAVFEIRRLRVELAEEKAEHLRTINDALRVRDAWTAREKAIAPVLAAAESLFKDFDGEDLTGETTSIRYVVEAWREYRAAEVAS